MTTVHHPAGSPPSNSENICKFPATLPGPDHHCIVEDGTYRAVFIGAEGFKFMRREPRLAMWFRIDGGTMVAGYYPVKILTKGGKAFRRRTRDPEFVVGWRSRLAKDLMTLFSTEFSATNLPTVVPKIVRPVTIITTTVKKDADGNPRPEALWSSKVDRIAGWASDHDADRGGDHDTDPCVDHYHDDDSDYDYYRFDDPPEGAA